MQAKVLHISRSTGGLQLCKKSTSMSLKGNAVFSNFPNKQVSLADSLRARSLQCLGALHGESLQAPFCQLSFAANIHMRCVSIFPSTKLLRCERLLTLFAATVLFMLGFCSQSFRQANSSATFRACSLMNVFHESCPSAFLVQYVHFTFGLFCTSQSLRTTRSLSPIERQCLPSCDASKGPALKLQIALSEKQCYSLQLNQSRL